MRIGVTGAFGYFGAHLAARLLERGHDLSAVSISPPAADLPARIAAIPARIADVADPGAMAGALSGCDAVVHGAAMAAAACERDPTAAMRVNGDGVGVVLDEARRAGVRRVVVLSSAHVYGEQRGRIDESHPIRPLSAYGKSKAAGERHAFGAAARGGIEVLVVRFSNGFGAPLSLLADCWTLALPSFARSAAETGRIRLLSAGTQQRDFLTLSDMATAVEILLAAPAPGGAEIAFNAGGGRSLSMRAAAALVAGAYAALTGVTPPIDLPPGSEGAPAEPPVDYRFDRLAALGYRPRGDLAAEARATLERLGVRTPA